MTKHIGQSAKETPEITVAGMSAGARVPRKNANDEKIATANAISVAAWALSLKTVSEANNVTTGATDAVNITADDIAGLVFI
jgi:hypothetical protein